MKNGFALVAVLLLMALTGCQYRSGSRSASTEQDSAAIAEIQAYQRRSMQAEYDVMAMVKADSVHRWTQHEFGWWYAYTHRSENHEDIISYALVKEVEYPIHETIYTLDGSRMIVDAIREYDNAETSPAMNGEEPFAYQMMLREIVPDDTVMLLIPWMLAYGRYGSDQVQPYTNILVRLTLHTEPCR